MTVPECTGETSKDEANYLPKELTASHALIIYTYLHSIAQFLQAFPISTEPSLWQFFEVDGVGSTFSTLFA